MISAVNDTTEQSAAADTITTWAGCGVRAFGGDGGPAAEALLNHPGGLVIDGEGNLLISDTYNHRVRAVHPDGRVSTVAGTGVRGFGGDGGPAAEALLNHPMGLVIDGKGNLLIAETQNHRIRAVHPDGRVSTVAGTGVRGFGGDGGPAAEAVLNQPMGVALDGAGHVYVGDHTNHRIRRIAPDGRIETVAGGGTLRGRAAEGAPATDAELYYPSDLAVSPSGTLYFTDTHNHRVLKVTPDGTLLAVAGTGIEGDSGDGGPAVEARLDKPLGLALDASGNLYIADFGNHRVRRVTPDGWISTLAGTGRSGSTGDSGPAASARLYYPVGVALDRSEALYIAEWTGHRVRRVLCAAAATERTRGAELMCELVSPGAVQRGLPFELGARLRNRGTAAIQGDDVTVTLALPRELIALSGRSGPGECSRRSFPGARLQADDGSLDGVFRILADPKAAPGLYTAQLTVRHDQRESTSLLTVAVVAQTPELDESALTVRQDSVPEAAPGEAAVLTVMLDASVGRRVQPGEIPQRFTAPTGFVFSGAPTYHYGGRYTGSLDNCRIGDSGRTLTVIGNPHLNTTGDDRGPLTYVFPVMVTEDAEAGSGADGRAVIGRNNAVPLAGTVKAGPGAEPKADTLTSLESGGSPHRAPDVFRIHAALGGREAAGVRLRFTLIEPPEAAFRLTTGPCPQADVRTGPNGVAVLPPLSTGGHATVHVSAPDSPSAAALYVSVPLLTARSALTDAEGRHD
ncbi:NHL repeat-containing protein [Streptomyces griseoruber]|uniref:NHL repeat-containing protein n=1 Tax=Streptomyces griseoruber TaxID=1943 RepID=UPI0006E24573|nr:NHL repeat-containing protein [Streptomyces griseoruber]